MQLSNYLNYKKIYIQCHDNPDADTLASAFGLYTYYISKGIDTRIIYCGRFQIRKSNLLLMIEKLQIPIFYVQSETLSLSDELLITVDCQYGAGNTSKIAAEHIAIIDHHQIEINPGKPVDEKDILILNNFGACSTIVWQLLNKAKIDVNENTELATALYYGLYTDTLQFAEIHNPSDKDMRDTLNYTQSVFSQLRNSNLSSAELEIAGIAMIRMIYNEANRYALIKSEPCDPNILGLISDMCIQVDNVDTCVVYNELSDGIKFSVRSCIKETKASDLAAYLANGIGSGGGHLEKAGGFISRTKYDEQNPGRHTEAYFSVKMQDYCESYDIIHAKTYHIDTSDMLRYKKRKLPVGYVIPTDILPINTPITIRTLEGDMDTVISDDMYIMVGIKGEVYTNSKTKFENSYNRVEEAFDLNVPYRPTVKSRIDGSSISLDKYIHACIPSGDVFIMAKPLTKAVKVFTKWYTEKYMLGNIGDYIAVRSDDPHDIYIIEKNIFHMTYEEN